MAGKIKKNNLSGVKPHLPSQGFPDVKLGLTSIEYRRVRECGLYALPHHNTITRFDTKTLQDCC